MKNKELDKYADLKKEIEWYYLFTQIYKENKYFVKQESSIELAKILLSESYVTENIKDED